MLLALSVSGLGVLAWAHDSAKAPGSSLVETPGVRKPHERAEPEAEERPAASQPAAPESAVASLSINRTWDVLRGGGKNPDPRRLLRQAGRELGRWKLQLAGNVLDGKALRALADSAPDEPLVRVVREQLGQAVDVDDLLLFLDDVLLAGRRGLRGETVWVTAGRARAAGILLHPDDVFEPVKPRRYAEPRSALAIDRPRRQARLRPAPNGAPLGPRWTTRFLNPQGEQAMMDALRAARPQSSFAGRVLTLMQQLREQGCQVVLHTTVRRRARGYLMWGAYELAHSSDGKSVTRLIHELERVNQRWHLNVPIRWNHPDGWQATIEAARLMAETYDVTYASKRGALRSRHYDGEAVDLTATRLPRTLKLMAPDGAQRSFDLSDPDQPRDLGLTPELIEWIERHYDLRKLRADYAHWNDEEALREHRAQRRDRRKSF